MSFISLSYLIFLPLVATIHFLLPRSSRWAWLLLASTYFYAVFIPKFLLVLGGVILIDYGAALWMESKRVFSRRNILYASLVANGSILFIFKYFNFFNQQVANLADWMDWKYSLESLNLLLPLGLSFHTFQSMSYTLEVYHGRQKAERHLGLYALYVMFFPQLVAGPIERPQNLLPQFHAPRDFDVVRASEGLRLILWGVFKKVVLADRLALLVDQAYGAGWRLSTGTALMLATIGFAFQIYYDFSAYTDIARGSAKILGVDLMKNFNFPYFATSIPDFWRRWHISLSTWFRDYVFFPLGGSRGSRARTAGNLLVIFLLSGLWHGANFTFLIWGLLHFTYMAMALYFRRAGAWWRRLPTLLQQILTFTLVTGAWVFFRAATVNQAGEILTEMTLLRREQTFQLFERETLICFLLIALATLGESIWRRRGGEAAFLRGPVAWRWTGYYLLLIAIFGLGVYSQNQFIYFQF